MSSRLDLADLGIRVYAGRLENHDFLWFSSFEIAKITRTAPIIHNYALSYALSGYSHGIHAGDGPDYEDDLRVMMAYVTPARPDRPPAWVRLTQNAINSKTLRTDDAPRNVNTPDLGWRVVLSPTHGASQGYSFYLFARQGFEPPGVVRLGKKGCAIRLRWLIIDETAAIWRSDATEPTHAVNPLDVQGRVVSYQPISIPPHLLLASAEIAEDWFVISGKHTIHVPRRLTPAGPLIRPTAERAPGARRRRTR